MCALCQTDLRHGQAWNHFTFYGRVRCWDGLIAILRVPVSAFVSLQAHSHIFRSATTASEKSFSMATSWVVKTLSATGVLQVLILVCPHGNVPFQCPAASKLARLAKSALSFTYTIDRRNESIRHPHCMPLHTPAEFISVLCFFFPLRRPRTSIASLTFHCII